MAHGIALIGVGIMGRRMIGRLIQHGGFRITALSDPSAAACAAAAAEAPGATIASSPAAIMARSDYILEYEEALLRCGAYSIGFELFLH